MVVCSAVDVTDEGWCTASVGDHDVDGVIGRVAGSCGSVSSGVCEFGHAAFNCVTYGHGSGFGSAESTVACGVDSATMADNGTVVYVGAVVVKDCGT